MILEAAENEFMQKGFSKARTTSIAESAGVTHAMLHYYFHTKEQLFERILDDKMQLMEQVILSAFDDFQLPLKDRIRHGIAKHFDFLVANPDLPSFLINEVYSHTNRYDALREKLQSTLPTLLASIQKEMDKAAANGEIEQIDARMLLMDIVSLNIFVFLAFPIFGPIMGDLIEDKEKFFEMRKLENIEVIMRRLKRQSR